MTDPDLGEGSRSVRLEHPRGGRNSFRSELRLAAGQDPVGGWKFGRSEHSLGRRGSFGLGSLKAPDHDSEERHKSVRLGQALGSRDSFGPGPWKARKKLCFEERCQTLTLERFLGRPHSVGQVSLSTRCSCLHRSWTLHARPTARFAPSPVLLTPSRSGSPFLC